MDCRKQLTSLITYWMMSSALGLVWLAQPATSQTLRPAITSDGPLPRLRPSTTIRRAPAPQPLPEEDSASAAAPAAIAPAIAAAGEESAETPAAADGASAEDAPAAPRAPSGLRPAVRDGDLSGEIEPADGADPAESEAYANPDGADMLSWDARSAEDAAAFERPPAGYDREAFTAEISPLLDRRPERLFRFEPWQPRGIRTIGGFIILPTVDIGGAALSNVFRSKPAQPDSAFELRPSIVLRSDWRTHALELRATGGLTYFDKFPSIDDRAWSLEARGRLDLTKRTQVTGQALHDVLQEAPGTLALRLSGGARAEVTTDQLGYGVAHRFNRLTVDLRGSVQQRDFSDTKGADGGIVSNRSRSLTTAEETARATWEFKPTLLAFAEASVNQRDFQAVSPLDGISRNSSGERFRFGVGFGNASQILRGEASLGWGQQTPDDRRLAPIDGFLLDANLAWRIDGMNALLLRANTDVVETTATGSPGGLARRGSLEWRHAFLKPLIGTAGVSYAATSYEGIALSETLTEYAVGLEYYLAPEALVFGRLQHSAYRVGNAGITNWDADEVRVGVRIRR